MKRIMTAVMLALVACGGHDDSVSGRDAQLGGMWVGTFVSDVAPRDYGIILQLRQASGMLTGAFWTYSPVPDVENPAGAITGSVEGSNFHLVLSTTSGCTGGSLAVDGSVYESGRASVTYSGAPCGAQDAGHGVLAVPQQHSESKPPPGGCCSVCTGDEACGDACVAASATCYAFPGCACNPG